MTKPEKIASLPIAITTSKRNDDTTYHHFSDSAPEELRDIFLEHYDVKDGDYERFGEACDLLAEIYNDNEQEQDGMSPIEEMIYERASEIASTYTAVRLEYLNHWNQEDITEYVKQMEVDIATACAIWYDKEVENMCFIIKEWVEYDELEYYFTN